MPSISSLGGLLQKLSQSCHLEEYCSSAIPHLWLARTEGRDPYSNPYIWGFPKIRGTLLGVPIIRTIVVWGLYWGPLILGNYYIPL